jgi:hypothetical protein
LFPSAGARYYSISRGIDGRPVRDNRIRYFFFFLAVFLAFFAFFAFFAMLPSMIPNDELTARLGISVRTSSVHHNC